MSVETETQLEAWLSDNMPESTGNPNTVETYTGTLDNPWGDLELNGLLSQVSDGDVTMSLEYDATAVGMGTGILYTNPSIFEYFSFQGISTWGTPANVWSAAVAVYTSYGFFDGVWVLSGETASDVSEYASSVTTILTVMRHPLPD